MTTWRHCMPGADLAPGEVLEIEWQGEDLLLYRTSNGECHALAAYCPHMRNYMPNGLAPGQALSALLHEDEILCPFHGWRFDSAGLCTHIPRGQRVPAAVARGMRVITIWPVREVSGEIQLAESSG